MIITPLISADTGAGAIGCARGSQTWSGITPAFVPIPTSAARAIAICSPEPELIAGGSPIAPSLGEEQDRDPGSGATEVGDRHVGEHRLPRLPVTVARDEDHGRRQKRHHSQPARNVSGSRAQRRRGEREQERCREHADDTPTQRRLQVAHREDERGGGDQPQHLEKAAAQTVDAETRIEGTRKRRAHLVPGSEHPETRDSDTGSTACSTSPARKAARALTRTPPSAIALSPAKQRAGHVISSSRRIDCWSTSRRVMIARPTSRRSKTRLSSTR